MAKKSKLVENAPHADITYKIVGAAMAVHNELGPGHREEVYQRAMIKKMADPPFELEFAPEPDLPVEDEEGRTIFVYKPDFLVTVVVILELKAHPYSLTDDDLAQVIDYFAACPKCEVALLINFGRPRLEWKRLFPPKHILEHRRRKWGNQPK
ncbi:MAG: GxxExxY protein [Chloroflexi bacterium]|nr:GxxExxY protein [Chloroflexota bacterium]